MRTRTALLVTMALLLAGCDGKAPEPEAAESGQSTAPVANGDTIEGLGASQSDVLGKKLVDADGFDLGTVTGFDYGADHSVDALIVKLADAVPAKSVALPTEGLTIVRTGGEIEVEANTNTGALLALPDAELAGSPR